MFGRGKMLFTGLEVGHREGGTASSWSPLVPATSSLVRFLGKRSGRFVSGVPDWRNKARKVLEVTGKAVTRPDKIGAIES